MKSKKDKELRDFGEIFDLTMERAARRGASLSAIEQVKLEECRGRVLAEDIHADRDVPPYNRVAVDGYACRRADLPGPLVLAGSSSAGDSRRHIVEQGCCVKVMTGGVLPEGADTVVMVENSREYTEGAQRLVAFEGVDPQSSPANYSPRGEDVPEGTQVLSAGTILQSNHIALLASVGKPCPQAAALPKVGLLSTGNEVVEPGTPPEAHQIRNANASQAAVQLEELKIEPTYYGIIPDDPKALTEALVKAKEENDLVLMSGGISMGDYDHGPEAMAASGFTPLYDRIAVKPGRPTTFAVSETADLFGLPGNPVSCFVIFEILVKPYLCRLMNTIYRPKRAFAVAAVPIQRKKTAREEWIPVSINEAGEAQPVVYHGSAHFQSLSRADGMIKIKKGERIIERGAVLAVRLF
ncbi:MAG: molybdopterin molybdotransferase MoeA [Spirochaetaceae bacterium]